MNKTNSSYCPLFILFLSFVELKHYHYLFFLFSGDKYYMFKLLNKEFTFDVDVSQLPCGLNGALYFVEMQEDGGRDNLYFASKDQK